MGEEISPLLADLIDLGIVLVGFALLMGGGDALVRGAIALAARLKISPLLIGMTVVAMGTSAPELMVSILSALSDHADIAIGNVIGSNIANVLLVLGVPILIYPMQTAQPGVQRQTTIMMAMSLGFVGLLFLGTIGRIEGLVLLVALAVFLYTCARGDVQLTALEEVQEQLGEATQKQLPYWQIVSWLLLGLALLPLGADFVVKSGSSLALSWGISEAVIGLTIVALGTSLPELATTVAAAFRKSIDVALGNVIGSNIFNMLTIVGITGVIVDLDIAEAFLQFDVWVMLLASLLLTVLVWRKQVLGLKTGLVLLPLGADFVVKSGSSLALSWGISEAVIGLTIVALGTSLPELATTVAAAFRKSIDVALGNVIGSNIFNMLAIVGITGVIVDLDIAEAFLQFDVWVCLLYTSDAADE